MLPPLPQTLGVEGIVKTVVLVCHAESEKNVQVERSSKAFERLSKGRFPSMEQLIGIQNVVFRSHANSALSKLGYEQANDMREILTKKRFWETLGDYYIACSPLKRAKQTLELIHPNLGRMLHRVKLLEVLREASVYESTVNSLELDSRIAEFETWLMHCPAPTVVVVGHPLFMRRMLNQKGVLRYTDVARVTLTINLEGESTWSGASLLHRSSKTKPPQTHGDMFH